MYPSLLATAPAIAKQSLRYRFDRLQAAYANAKKTGLGAVRATRGRARCAAAEETPAFG